MRTSSIHNPRVRLVVTVALAVALVVIVLPTWPLVAAMPGATHDSRVATHRLDAQRPHFMGMGTALGPTIPIDALVELHDRVTSAEPFPVNSQYRGTGLKLSVTRTYYPMVVKTCGKWKRPCPSNNW
jgi:hypothetical protein